LLHREAAEERGSVASEYGVLSAIIARAIVAAAGQFGVTVAHLFDPGRPAIP